MPNSIPERHCRETQPAIGAGEFLHKFEIPQFR